MTEWLRSCDRLSVTCTRRRWRTSNRLTLVTLTITIAIATTSRTWVRIPGFRCAGSAAASSGRVSSRYKLVPRPVDGEEVLRIGGVLFKFLPEFEYLIVYGSGSWVEIEIGRASCGE